MLLAGCSTVCTTVAEAAKMWNLIVVSFTNIIFITMTVMNWYDVSYKCVVLVMTFVTLYEPGTQFVCNI